MSGEAGMSAVRLWGGRFESGPADALARLSMSVQFDWRLARYDLLASSAHARVLHRAGLLDDKDLERLLVAIDELSRACQTGEFRPTAADEDVHTALERGLLERVGSLGGRLRAGRSRNDQVATDLRMYLRDHARRVVARLAELQTALMEQAGRHLAEQTPAPGMTHLQHAQPVLACPRAGSVQGRGTVAGLGQPGRDLPARLRRVGRFVAAGRS